LQRVAVAAGLVSAAVDHPGHGFDAEVGVAHSPVTRELRRGVLDVEAVVSRCDGDVAAKDAVAVRRGDREPVAATASDHISADHVVGAAESGSLECEMDAVPPGADDDVAGDQVAAPLLDQDPTLVAQAAVTGNRVSVAENDNAGTASGAAVASHLIAVALQLDVLGAVA
jgi:hypothetical protein